MRPLVALVVAAAVATSSTPHADADEDEVQAALRRRLLDEHRRNNIGTYHILRDAELALDAVEGLPVAGDILAVTKTALIPAYIAGGDTVIGQLKTSIDQELGEAMASALKAAIGDRFERLDANETMDQVEKNFGVLENLDKAAKKAGLSPSEQGAIRGVVEQGTRSQLHVAALRGVQTSNDLRAVAKRAVALDKSMKLLDSRLGDVEQAMVRYEQLTADSKARQIEWIKREWDAATLSQKIDVAKTCGSPAPSPHCVDMSSKDIDQLVARGDIRDAAADVGRATALYVKGAAQIASNLGVEIPEWASNAINSGEAVAGLVEGIAGGRPEAIIGGLVGLSGLFRKAHPSPDARVLQALAAIDKRLQRMEKQLADIDAKLMLVLKTQKAIIDQLNQIEAKIDTMTSMLSAVIAVLDLEHQKALKRCDDAHFSAEMVGAWGPFFRADRVHPSTASILTKDKTFEDVLVCRAYVQNTFGGTPLVTSLQVIFDEADKGTADHVINDQKAAEAYAKAIQGMLGGLSLAAFEATMLTAPASRTERVIRAAELDAVTAVGVGQLADVGKFLSLRRVLAIAAIIAVDYRMSVAAVPRGDALLPKEWEPIENAQRLLARYVVQSMVLDTDAVLATVAVRLVDSMPDAAWRTDLGVLLGDYRGAASDAEKQARARKFIGDLFEAQLWRASPTTMQVERELFRMAWAAGETDVLALRLGRQTLPTGGTMAASFAVESSAAGNELCLVKGAFGGALEGLAARCLSLADFTSRDREDSPSGVEIARHWMRVLAGERR